MRDGVATADLLLALVRLRLGTGPSPEPAGLRQCDWDRLERLAAHHGLITLLHRTIEDRQLDVPGELCRRLRLAYYANHLRNTCLVRLRDEIASALAGSGIVVTLVKGASLLQTIYAADPGQRRLSDIDLLVDEGDLEPADAQLQRLGLSRVRSREEAQRGPASHFHHLYQRDDSFSIPLELHWRLFETHQPYLFGLTEARARALPVEGMALGVRVLAPEHELAHLCNHLGRHAMVFGSLVDHADWRAHLVLTEGQGRLIWLYDIAVYLQQRSHLVRWDRFLSDTERWVLAESIHPIFELCSRAFGVEPPSGVLDEMKRRAPRPVKRLAGRLLLSAYSEGQRSPAAMGRHFGPERIRRVLYTWEWIFPPRAYLRQRYARRRNFVAAWLAHARQVLPGLWREAVRRFGRGTRVDVDHVSSSEAHAAKDGREPAVRWRGPALRTELAFCPVDEDWIAYDPISDRITVLNRAAAAIIAACDGMHTFDEIGAQLRRSVTDAPPELEQEIRRVLGELAAAGLLRGDSITRELLQGGSA